MIGSLFNDLNRIERDDRERSEASAADNSAQESDNRESLIASLEVAEKIVRRKGLASWKDEAADILQTVALRLLKWRDKYREKSEDMSPADWNAFAARTAYNEIKRHYSKTGAFTDVSIDTVRDIDSGTTIEGQSEAEVSSLGMAVWQKVCSFPLRQRQSVVLGSQDLAVRLIQAGISDERVAESLSLSLDEWLNIKAKIPLKNLQIAEFIKRSEGSRKEAGRLVGSLKKARHEARKKIRKVTDK